MASVRIQAVTKNFGNFVAVDNLNLEVVDKEFLVLLGPSGCGKTTTMRMVAGLEEVSAGDLYFGAERVNDVLPKYRDVAMVFQSYALYPHLTVADNIGYPLMIRKVPAAERKRGSKKSPAGWSCRRCCTGCPGAFRRPAPAGGAGPGHRATPRSSCLTSRCPISTQAARADARRVEAAAA